MKCFSPQTGFGLARIGLVTWSPFFNKKNATDSNSIEFYNLIMEKEMETFKKGDVVKLKSGGPKMAIYSIDSIATTCQWFDGTTLQSGLFQPEQLEVYQENDKPRRVHNSNRDY